MIYDIENKSDFISGTSLIVRIPEDEVDITALYTIQADEPDFILPFRHRNIDGQVEFVYQIGANCKLQYLAGRCSPGEYTRLWDRILRPLLECGDWFMKPYCMVLDAGYLYCEKNKKTVRYIYIPAIRECSTHRDLKEMAAEIVKLVSIEDIDLENKVLRSIMKDFKPNEFLRMLESYLETSAPADAPRCVFNISSEREKIDADNARASDLNQTARITPEIVQSPNQETGYQEANEAQEALFTSGDIIINIPTDGAPVKKSKVSRKSKESKEGEKGSDEQKDGKVTGGFFRRKKESRQDPGSEIILNYQLAEEAVHISHNVYAPQLTHNDNTQSVAIAITGTRLRLIGSLPLPPFIDVNFQQGEVFTVGRFDAVVGKQQSSFEFDKKTKAVSRRHAAIERIADSYSIIDLSSSAGTYIDGQKLPPNTPYKLGNGCRVSFGNAGADYIWEV